MVADQVDGPDRRVVVGEHATEALGVGEGGVDAGDDRLVGGGLRAGRLRRRRLASGGHVLGEVGGVDLVERQIGVHAGLFHRRDGGDAHAVADQRVAEQVAGHVAHRRVGARDVGGNEVGGQEEQLELRLGEEDVLVAGVAVAVAVARHHRGRVERRAGEHAGGESRRGEGTTGAHGAEVSPGEHDGRMRVLFATAELAPIAAVGGLAQAAAGLVAELRAQGVDVDLVMPDYGGIELDRAVTHDLAVPAWAGPASVRSGVHADAGPLSVVTAPGLARSHPYLQPDGHGWPDNDRRFLSFCQAVAAIVEATQPDIVHLNDWHTGATLAALDGSIASVLSLHNVAYQGFTDGAWLRHLGPRARHYEWFGGTNPLSGAIALADAIVAVSPTHAREILTPEGGFGLDGPLRNRWAAVSGILNGIDTTVWDPETDPGAGAQLLGGGRRGRSGRAAREANRDAVRDARRLRHRRRSARRRDRPVDGAEGRRPARADRADPAVDPAAPRRPRLRRGGHRRATVDRGGRPTPSGSRSSTATTRSSPT